jgi:hypothetical protein
VRKITALLLVILPFTLLKGQNDFFRNIRLFEEGDWVGKPKLVYFHFKGCPPCKRMDNEVFSLSNVRVYLDSNFFCFEVYGFDSLETRFRETYDVKGDPTFLFLNENDKEIHRIVGFFDEGNFLAECNKADSSISLSRLDNMYSQKSYDLAFLKEYIHTKERARQLDSNLIFEYLNSIPDSKLLDNDFFIDLLHYGYYEGIWEQPIHSRYYKAIKNAYQNELYPDFHEEIRNRMIFSLNFHLYRMDFTSTEVDTVIAELKKLENGSRIVLKDIHSNGYFAYLQDRYPSFEFEYKRALNTPGGKNHTEVFKQHATTVNNNAQELNSLAWGIYEGKYPESPELGIELVKRALEISPTYGYYDTYAALLFQTGNFDEAKTVALHAIEVAKTSKEDYSETEALLVKIESATSGMKK